MGSSEEGMGEQESEELGSDMGTGGSILADTPASGRDTGESEQRGTGEEGSVPGQI